MSSYLLKDPDVLCRCISEIHHSMGMEVIIKKPVRSQRSNRLYWAIINIIAKEIGEDSETLHSMLKLRVFGPQIVVIRGETITIPKHSKDLSQKDFNTLIDAANVLAMNLGVKIPAASYYGYEE